MSPYSKEAPMAHSKTLRIGSAAGILLLSTLALSSCSASAPSESMDSGVVDERLVEMGGDTAELSPDEGAKIATDSAIAPVEEAPAEILTSNLQIRVKDPKAAADSARSIVEASGGSVSYSVERPSNDYEYGSAMLTLRVPPEDLREVTVELEKLGTVVSSESGSQDVSRQKTDYEVRIQSLRTSIERLNGLLAQSQSTADLIEIERELQSRESQLESMTAALADLDDSIDYATIGLSLTSTSKDSPTPVDPENFFSGFERGLQGLATFGAGLLVVLGVALPWLLTAAILVSIAMAIAVAVRKNRRKKAPAPVRSEPSSEVLGKENPGTDERTEEG